MCNCISDVESKLDDQRLAVALIMRGNTLIARPYVALFRKDKGVLENRRGKPKSFIATYCPWCGVRYEDEPAEPTGAPS